MWECSAEDYFYEPVSGLNLEDVPLGSLDRFYPQYKEIPDFEKKLISPEIEQKKTAEDEPESNFSRVSNERQQDSQVDQDNKNYIQKMANQLYAAQKHVSVLSNYQKYILNQDPLVKKYVFANQKQSRYRSKNKEKTVKSEPRKHSEAQSRSSNDIAKDKSRASSKDKNEENSKKSDDHTTKPTEVQYYAITTPQLSKVKEEVPEPMVAFVYTPKPYPYYELEATAPPPTADSIFQVNAGSYAIPPAYQQFEGTYDETDHNHVSVVTLKIYYQTNFFFFESSGFGNLKTKKKNVQFEFIEGNLNDNDCLYNLRTNCGNGELPSPLSKF